MKLTLAFDVYGTLINTHGVVTELSTMIGERAQLFSQTWRDKQLEYTFRRAAMGDYQHFGVCTEQALDYTCAHLGAELDAAQRQTLLQKYRALPAFADVVAGLDALAARGHALYAFSNGVPDGIEAVLHNAGIRHYFAGVVSVDPVRTFKPDPRTYQHFLTCSGAAAAATWLVSSNPFDVIGARRAGLDAAWVQRDRATAFDPWEIEPSLVVESLALLANRLPPPAN